MMAWLFERTIELAAWVAMILAWVAFGFSIYWFCIWIGTFNVENGPDPRVLLDSGRAAGAFITCALVLGGLACVDRFIYDAEDFDQKPRP